MDEDEDEEEQKFNLVGLTVTEVREMTREELEHEGWEDDGQAGHVIVFSDGSTVYAARDPEGNGPGMLFGNKGGQSYYVLGEDSE